MKCLCNLHFHSCQIWKCFSCLNEAEVYWFRTVESWVFWISFDVGYNRNVKKNIFFCLFLEIRFQQNHFWHLRSFSSLFLGGLQKSIYERFMIRYPGSVWPRSGLFHWTHQKKIPYLMFFKMLFAMCVTHVAFKKLLKWETQKQDGRWQKIQQFKT